MRKTGIGPRVCSSGGDLAGSERGWRWARGVVAVACAVVLAQGALVRAQPSGDSPLLPPANGPRRADPTWIALAGAVVHVSPERTMHGATVVLRDGVITAVLPAEAGPDGAMGTPDDVPARVPMGPRVIDVSGQHLYPGFIDGYVEVETPREAANAVGAHWNGGVQPRRSALDGVPVISEGLAGSLRGLGFVAAGVAPKGGVFRGSGAVVSLARPSGDASVERPPVYREHAYQSVVLEMGDGYPSSQMGAIALVRQTLSDVAWLAEARASGRERGPLTALDWLLPAGAEGPARATTLLFSTDNELEFLRVAAIAKEFGRQAMVLGSGREFARLDAIRATGHSVLLPINFPRAPDVASPSAAEATELSEMMLWEQAPTNPRRLQQAGVRFALTTAKLRDRGDFWQNLRKAMRHGLSREAAFAALTTTPAAMLGVETQVGSVEVGKRASLVLASGELFETSGKAPTLRMVVIDGVPHELEREDAKDAGDWVVTGLFEQPTRIRLAGGELTLLVGAEAGKDEAGKEEGEGDKESGPVEIKARRVMRMGAQINFVFDTHDLPEQAAGAIAEGVATASIVLDRDATPMTALGRVLLPDGSERRLSATRTPRSLAGVWPFWGEAQGDAPGELLGTLVVDEAGGWSIRLGDALDSRTAEVREVAWDGVRAEGTFALSDGRIATLSAGVTWEGGSSREGDEPQMTGRLTFPDGTGRAVMARLRGEDPFVGRWRISEALGNVIAEEADEQFTIVVGEESLRVIRAKKGERDKTARSEDAKREEGVLTFSHSLDDLEVGEGKSTDRVRIRFGRTRAEDRLEGVSRFDDGSEHAYVAVREEDDEAQRRSAEDEAIRAIPERLGVPFGPYGLLEVPAQETVYLINATVWTGTERGVLQGATVVLREGKIGAVLEQTPPEAEKENQPEGVRVIDCAGKHVTAGIIDAHSHTGISRGVNEGGQAVTAEVRIQDVTNPDDVNWYRQLAGGVTTVLSLHGSANAIGGQSQVNKIRWGARHPSEMHMEGVPSGIKFALGENPRQVNWDASSTRYPKTRMGVETLIRDRFVAARQYASDRRSDPTTRRDLELEAIAEILAGERLVHCHSYRQDEILMLSQVAREFSFRIGTYQHVLEGYKVAEVLRDFSGGGSGFADWWNFKVEVQDAIPAAFPLMHRVGATVSYNSDSNALARFLNVEAGKAVKYGREVGGITPEEAWTFVTLNPAKQLKIDGRVGSVREGNDADVVVWSGDPLSTYTRCERTFVDGRELFSLEQDAAHRSRIAGERQRLISAILADARRSGRARESGERSQRPGNVSERYVETTRARMLEMLRSGRDPLHAPGVCGCDW